MYYTQTEEILYYFSTWFLRPAHALLRFVGAGVKRPGFGGMNSRVLVLLQKTRRPMVVGQEEGQFASSPRGVQSAQS